MTNFSYTGSHPLEAVVKSLTTDRDEWKARALAAEAEAAQLRAKLDEARAGLAAQWIPAKRTPNDREDTDYLGWDGFRQQVVTYKPDADYGEDSWPWRDWYDDDVPITHYQPLPAAPGDGGEEG